MKSLPKGRKNFLIWKKKYWGVQAWPIYEEIDVAYKKQWENTFFPMVSHEL